MNIEEGRPDEDQHHAAERSGEGEDHAELRNDHGDDVGENGPDESLENAAMRRPRLLEEGLVDADEGREGEHGVGEESDEGVRELDDVHVPCIAGSEVREEIVFGVRAIGEVAAETHQVVDQRARHEGDVVRTVHFLDARGEFGFFRKLQLGGHLRNVDVGGQTGEEDRYGGREGAERLREPVVVQRLNEDLANTHDDGDHHEENDTHDCNGGSPLQGVDRRETHHGEQDEHSLQKVNPLLMKKDRKEYPIMVVKSFPSNMENVMNQVSRLTEYDVAVTNTNTKVK